MEELGGREGLYHVPKMIKAVSSSSASLWSRGQSFLLVYIIMSLEFTRPLKKPSDKSIMLYYLVGVC